MKNAFSLIILLTLAACNLSESSKSKSCTLNGEAVDCSTFESRSSSGQSAGEKITLSSQVSSRILLKNETFEILENTYDRKAESIDGESYECETATVAGEQYTFHINGNQLELSNEEGSGTLKRVEGPGRSLEGSWAHIEKFEGGVITTTFTFAENQMTVSAKCEFN